MPDVLMARLDPLVCLAQVLTYRESGGLECVVENTGPQEMAVCNNMTKSNSYPVNYLSKVLHS